jgi:protein arginine kinase activator
MMLCDECLKNPATVHMTTFVNGQVKTVHLCAQCAAKRKTPVVISGFSFNDLLSAFYETEDTQDAACESCGTTMSSFQKTGRLGCANCYKAFEASLMPVLKGLHMSTQHTGKRPGERVAVDLGREASSVERREQMKRSLRMAISTENFEEAARLRDEIARIEKEGV